VQGFEIDIIKDKVSELVILIKFKDRDYTFEKILNEKELKTLF
jgi:hypothetical protein